MNSSLTCISQEGNRTGFNYVAFQVPNLIFYNTKSVSTKKKGQVFDIVEFLTS